MYKFPYLPSTFRRPIVFHQDYIREYGESICFCSAGSIWVEVLGRHCPDDLAVRFDSPGAHPRTRCSCWEEGYCICRLNFIHGDSLYAYLVFRICATMIGWSVKQLSIGVIAKNYDSWVTVSRKSRSSEGWHSICGKMQVFQHYHILIRQLHFRSLSLSLYNARYWVSCWFDYTLIINHFSRPSLPSPSVNQVFLDS